MNHLRLIAVLLAFAACGDSGKPATPDAPTSICGNPGDMGNSIGVGKYCTSINDCFSTQDAPLCAVLGDPNAHFCTRTCQLDGGANDCGENAICQCGSGSSMSGCGCLPTACR